MVTVSRTIRVDAPVDEVFTYVDEPENHVEMTPSITDVSNVEAPGDAKNVPRCRAARHAY